MPERNNAPTSPPLVAFLRAINVGKRRVSMATLAGHFEAMGFTGVGTFIASGNVVFQPDGTGAALATSQGLAPLEARIEAHLKEALGYEVDTFLRPAREVADIAGGEPFPDETGAERTIHLSFLKAPLSSSAVSVLETVDNGYDRFCFRPGGVEFCWLCRGRISSSTIWEQPEIRALKLPTMTMRNLTSLRKLVAKHFPDLAQG